MPQITHFVLALSFGIGLAAIVVSAQMCRRYQLGFLRAHLAIVTTFNLMIFINIVALYIFNLPPSPAPDRIKAAAGTGLQFLVPFLQLLAAYFFLHIIWGMLGKSVTARLRNIARAVIFFYAALQAMALALPRVLPGIALSKIVSRLVWLSILAVICMILLAGIRQVGRVADEKKRCAIKAYYLLLLGLITVVIVLIFLQYAGILTITKYNLLAGILIVGMNAVPILYLGWFAEKFYGIPKTDWQVGPDSTRLFDEYDISSREQEIVRLICSGKTNREIANELFISLQTVKDHVYRIFRKTGVKNRVQMVNLFRR